MDLWVSPRRGFCGVTSFGTGCSPGATSGAWHARAQHIDSLADCAARCLACDGCSFVSFSAQRDDCSWFRHCRLGALRTDTEGGQSFRSVRVRWLGNATASAAAAAHWQSLTTRPVMVGRGSPWLPAPMAACMAADGTNAAAQRGVGAAAPSVGYCAATAEDTEGDCLRGESGS